ncbi:glycosyltransferase [Comamonas sp. NoAH]|uniref:glycosyltransferase n=1 Tax=Comamonas halotolerans TaxID=3041496 RepID=UPI0024E15D94|nr:glycosyltransferase [Comamonas sp. NoAH]
MMGIAIPAHNEAQHIVQTLQSIKRSIDHYGQSALVVVVADACTDCTLELSRPLADHVIEANVRDVGTARAMGAQWLLDQGAQWLACTDADSLVPNDWLTAQSHMQQQLQFDLFCGIVKVEDWGDYSQEVIQAFHATTPQDGHPHIHGANLGISRKAYELVGGFKPAHAHEDVSLVHRCEKMGLRIARLINPCVTTSARRNPRAREGFGEFLLKLEQIVHQQSTLHAPTASS